MPPFSSFLKNSDRQDQNGKGVNAAINSGAKVQRRQSKRDYFRNLLRRPSIQLESRGNKRQSDQSVTSNLQQPTPSSPKKPSSSTGDPNKPLPPPPLPVTVQAEPTPRPSKKLQRILHPFTVPDIHKLFSGAPQFSTLSEGYHTGAPYPSVAFPWDQDVAIRDLRDYIQIKDAAWECITAWPHITLDWSPDSEEKMDQHQNHTAHYFPRCRERPDMSSMQGIERGTIGYQAALEIGVADSLREESSEGGSDPLPEIRKTFLNGKDGLRPLTESTLIERLKSVSKAYNNDSMMPKRPTVELYTELFTKILFPPSRVTDADDPYSIQVQIEALVHVLVAPEVWVDFSLVEWRIKLGQIIWGQPNETDVQNHIDRGTQHLHETNSDFFWLLLQILLSCELLIRLDSLSKDSDHGLHASRLTDIRRFDKTATTSVKWSLVLAHCWLENIRIERRESNINKERNGPVGWLATWTGRADFNEEDMVEDNLGNIHLQGRYEARQLSGLLHFARKLAWPNFDRLTAQVSSAGITVTDSSQNTPAVGTPFSVSSQHSTSYFGNTTKRPGIRRRLSKQQRMSAVISTTGWLSNSYISSLVLPGEGLSHFLISTLLENDNVALSSLGEEVNLYGGFVYGGMSFWSTACIVGRVLAAGKGASECMGWVSSDVTPQLDGWVNIDVNEPLGRDPDLDIGKPRIWHTMAIEHDSNVIGGADSSSVLPGDFSFPSDETSPRPMSVTLESLELSLSIDTTTEEGQTPLTDFSDTSTIQNYSASMRFSVESNGATEIVFALKHDVYFVTAHPCVSSHYEAKPNSPTSQFARILEQNQDEPSGFITGHPLHKAFTYFRTPLYDIISSPSTPLYSLISPPQSPHTSKTTKKATSGTMPKILVIDCRDDSASPKVIGKDHVGSDIEMLARALCADRGWNALVSRGRRGCLACAIREAGALGWQVVLRFP